MSGTRRRQANINTSGLIPFQPGQSGNAGRTRDRNSTYRGMLRLCRVNSAEAVRVLLACMQDPGAPWPARVVAANSILDRGWGRPKEHLHVDGDGIAGLTIEFVAPKNFEQEVRATQGPVINGDAQEAGEHTDVDDRSEGAPGMFEVPLPEEDDAE